MLMCSQAWICCFCLVNFSRKREKAICARRGLGETASKTRKADGQAPVFLYTNILLHLLCSRCLVSLNPQLVWAQVSGAWWKGSQCRILQLTVNSHIHRFTQASFGFLQRNPGLTPLSSSTTKHLCTTNLIFAESSKCCCSRHENPVNIPFQFD